MSPSASPEAEALVAARDSADTTHQETTASPPAEETTKSAQAKQDESPEAEDKGESSEEEGAASPVHSSRQQSAAPDDAPPLPEEPVPGDDSSAPPLPAEAPPADDDGWDCQWDPSAQSWFFHNRFTGKSQWENPRVPTAAPAAAPGTAAPGTAAPGGPPLPAAGGSDAVVTGYNPAIHGDYDPNAWYAKGYGDDGGEDAGAAGVVPGEVDVYASTAQFNRFTGQFQTDEAGPGRHSDEAKSRRQLNAFFDVDAAANAHNGRSLRAERSQKKPSKSELKAFKEKRRSRKEEKRRAWLRD